MTEHDKLRATIARWQDRAEWLQAALIDAEVEIERLTRAAPANEAKEWSCDRCGLRFETMFERVGHSCSVPGVTEAHTPTGNCTSCDNGRVVRELTDINGTRANCNVCGRIAYAAGVPQLDPFEVKRAAESQGVSVAVPHQEMLPTNSVAIHCMRCGDAVDPRPKPFSIVGGDEKGHDCKGTNAVPWCPCGNATDFSCTQDNCARELFLRNRGQ